MDIDRTTPHYLQPEDIDRLARQNLQLMTELWITKDRLIMLEDMLQKAGVIDRDTLDTEIPKEALEDEIKAERVAYLKRILQTDTNTRSAETLSQRAVKK